MRASLALAALAALPAFATPSGHMWFQTACSTRAQCEPTNTCVSSKCVPEFRLAASIDNSGATTVTGQQHLAYSTFLSRAPVAFARWTTSNVSACATSYQVSSAGTFSAPAGIAAVNGSDGANDVIWLSGGNWRYSSATLGLTTGTFVTSTGQLLDSDMEFNDNVEWTDNGTATAYDMESVVLHEAGHFLGLDHTTTIQAAVMYPTVAFGDQKRTLASPDSTDVCTVYPGAAGSQGAPCTSPSNCTGGRVCEGAPGATQKICTQDCTGTGASCPVGYSCQPSSAGYACLSQTGASDLCKFCSKGSDCSTGVCITDGAGHNWCSLSCSSTAQCGTGNECAGGFCQPTGGALCTNQCSTASSCAVGYTCSGGTCQPTGNTGDRCEVSVYCKSCNVCILDPNDNSVAFCRACCGGQGRGANCTACTAASCGASQSCVPLTNGKDSICLPAGGGTLCNACSGQTCGAGMTCVGGSCHSSCNPASPGACPACLDIGGGQAVCACTNEVAGVGDPCGVTSSSLLACANGLVCVSGTPARCRATCNLSVPASCGPGESCQNVGGNVGVCLPTAGLRCGACSATGTCSGTDTCYNGQCYQSCNMNQAGHCATCVQTAASGEGVCACSNQISATGDVCGLPSILACNSTDRCINGVCRQPCDPAQPFLCPASTECKPYADGTYCVDLTGAGGGGGSGGSGGSGGAGGGTGTGGSGGAGGGTTADSGCGCTSGTGLAALWPFAVVALASRRRRR